MRFNILFIVILIICLFSIFSSSKFVFKNEKKSILSDSEDAKKGLPNEKLWTMYRRSLFYFLKRTDKDGFKGMQMVSYPFEANWHTNPEQLTIIANKMSKWGSNYEVTAKTFPKQFEKFLSNLKMLPSSASNQDKKKFAELAEKVENADDKIDEAINNCYNDYNLVKDSIGGLTYSQFEPQFCPNVEQLKHEKKQIGGQFKEFYTKVKGIFSTALKTLDECTSDSTHEWTDDGYLKNFVEKAKKGETSKLEISTSNWMNIKESREWYKSKSSGFIFRKTSNEEKKELRFNSEKLKMTIKAEGYAGIQIRPKGKWFNISPIRQFKDKNYWVDKKQTFFGPNGSLNLMPKMVYVIYKPKVILRLSKKDGLLFSKFKQSSCSFACFYSSKKKSKMTIRKVNDDDYEVTFSNLTDEVNILAIDQHIL